ncbi:MAG: ribokinase [Sphingobium sp.]|nr:ribokinase [Sphingobium sp.]
MADRQRNFTIGSFVAGCVVKVDTLPSPGESRMATSCLLEVGGKGFNMLAGLNRLGVAVDGIIAVGDDLIGRCAPSVFAEEGLPAHMLHRFPGPSGGAAGFTDAEGESCLAVYPGANALLNASHMRALKDRITGATIVSAQFEAPDEAISAAFAIARTAGRQTLLNPSPYRPISPEILTRCSILIVNRVEAACLAVDMALTGEIAPDQPPQDDIPMIWHNLAQALFAEGVELVIITLGAQGAFAFRNGTTPYFQPAFQVDTRDMMGAGDAFNAGLMAAMLSGKALEEAMTWAAACGAAATCGLGVLSNLPGMTDMQAIIQNAPAHPSLFAKGVIANQLQEEML